MWTGLDFPQDNLGVHKEPAGPKGPTGGTAPMKFIPRKALQLWRTSRCFTTFHIHTPRLHNDHWSCKVLPRQPSQLRNSSCQPSTISLPHHHTEQ